ncbi:HSF-type DNA-binding-domain-containing protein [Roridomyces roridus]|uniref:HSF-type DNA-binding-domain-containing protein n=1 Tax=Roridomyces roridus TaxID=1738132 RepID=A0AAD7C675_9AGAR|nr:HSF-type DNA-binding-domain-containing protein [Roridomyces roridus]
MSGNDLYVPATYSSRSYPRDQYSSHQPYAHHPDSSDNASNDDLAESPNPKSADQPSQKSETKPQATFLTKLYALLERSENHHMIRWDPQGEHIVVERPEQLALHVLPSIYRQSRFASFSRQLNIYGFMRKVNLRNVDPAIDDPDASTWSHPTLNRHSPPEVVANFKRRVPPRLPKPRKRDPQDSPSIPAPRSAVGMGPVPLTVPSSVGPSAHKSSHIGRPRGFSSPGAFPPIIQNSAPGSSWSNGGYSRATLPPLTVPNDQGGMYHHSSHPLHPLTPSDDSPTSPAFNSMPPYSTSSSQYPYQDQNHWSSQNSSYSSHNGSLSSLLNPSSGGYSRPAPPPSINTSYTSPFSSMPMEHSASSMSPDSRPTTGYSMSSVGSMTYGDDYSRPNSSHHRPISPSRPPSSKGSYSSNSLIVRRGRRHSQAMSPYPSPYESPAEQRPSTSPQPIDDHHGSSLPRVRSMIQLPSVEQYSFSGQPEFAYSAVPGAVGSTTSIDSLNDSSSWHAQRSGRPSTAASSISAASHTSSSQANTPPVQDYHGDTDINRYSPDEHHFGFVAMNEHLPQQYSKSPNEM